MRGERARRCVNGRGGGRQATRGEALAEKPHRFLSFQPKAKRPEELALRSIFSEAMRGDMIYHSLDTISLRQGEAYF